MVHRNNRNMDARLRSDKGEVMSMRMIDADALSRVVKLAWDTSDSEDFEKSVFIAIATAPTIEPEPRWIPCSERLPEDIKPVIVTWKNVDPKSYYQYIVGKHFIGTAHYKNGKWFWYSSVTEDLLAEYGKCDSEEFDEAIEVVAWMPLPEPYREGEQDENR